MFVIALGFFVSFVYANETAEVNVVDGGTSAIYATE